MCPSSAAEREGFEPPGREPFRFQGGCIWPLCHRSVGDAISHSAPARPANRPTLGSMTDEAHLDRAAVDRIIRRASELAGPERSDDPHMAIDAASLIAAAHEVGLPAIAVQRSLAVEHLGELPEQRFGDRFVGQAILAVDDEIAGSADDVLARVDAWLVHGHHLRRDRLREGRGEWSKRSGVVGVTVRQLRFATGEGRLGQYRRVTATAHDIGSGSAVVRVAVDRSNERRRSAASGAAVVIGGTGGLVAAAVAAPLVLLATPIVVVGGIGVALNGRTRAARTAAEVERMLEAVADHEAPTRLRSDVVRRVSGRRPGNRPSRRIRTHS
jgi:hypothetical protein